MEERYEHVCSGKVYHRRGLEPRRRVTVPLDGRRGLEHDCVIEELYHTDKLTIADIARLYGVKHGTISQRINRCRRRQATERGDELEARRRTYGKVLGLLEETELDYREIAAKACTSYTLVRRIALRNGLGRK